MQHNIKSKPAICPSNCCMVAILPCTKKTVHGPSSPPSAIVTAPTCVF